MPTSGTVEGDGGSSENAIGESLDTIQRRETMKRLWEDYEVFWMALIMAGIAGVLAVSIAVYAKHKGVLPSA